MQQSHETEQYFSLKALCSEITPVSYSPVQFRLSQASNNYFEGQSTNQEGEQLIEEIIRERLQSIVQENKYYKEEILDLQQQNEILLEQLQHYQKSKSNYYIALQQLERENEQLQNELKQLRQDYEKQKLQIKNQDSTFLYTPKAQPSSYSDNRDLQQILDDVSIIEEKKRYFKSLKEMDIGGISQQEDICGCCHENENENQKLQEQLKDKNTKIQDLELLIESQRSSLKILTIANSRMMKENEEMNKKMEFLNQQKIINDSHSLNQQTKINAVMLFCEIIENSKINNISDFNQYNQDNPSDMLLLLQEKTKFQKDDRPMIDRQGSQTFAQNIMESKYEQITNEMSNIKEIIKDINTNICQNENKSIEQKCQSTQVQESDFQIPNNKLKEFNKILLSEFSQDIEQSSNLDQLNTVDNSIQENTSRNLFKKIQTQNSHKNIQDQQSYYQFPSEPCTTKNLHSSQSKCKDRILKRAMLFSNSLIHTIKLKNYEEQRT